MDFDPTAFLAAESIKKKTSKQSEDTWRMETDLMHAAE
jgi:hypothetical protein